MGIQINGNTDTISATDGSLIVSGAELPAVININATGIITATSFVGNGSALTGIAGTANVVTNSLVVSGITTVAAGSTAAPSITPSGDSNTGIFFPAADTIAFGEGGAESMRIDSSSRLLLGTTSANANGGVLQLSSGITFPATQVASTDANTLDDYEEGTWTPNAGSGSTYGANNYGIYTKIGNVVTCQFHISVTTFGGGGLETLTGLPFTSANINDAQTGSVSYYSNLNVSTIFLAILITNNANTCTFVGKAASGATVDNGLSLFKSGTNIYGTMTYRVA